MRPNALLAVTSLLLAGCLSHLPPTTHAHMRIHWSSDYAAAAREAARTDRPVLACLVAGEIDGLC
jgi:hypothetical protein